jgi:hypothetical protein
MAAPANIPRDYAGGVVEGVQLTAQIGPTDLSFTIANTTGWVNAAGHPLGTVGPFTVVIDSGTPSAEKISCSLINLSSGLVTVDTAAGWTGRGFDQTTAQAHVVGASPLGVQPCWSAVEAAEANAAVVFGPGGGGAVTGLTGNPAGRIFLNANSSASTFLPFNGMNFLVGSMTDDLATNHSLIVPTTGYYQVSGNYTCSLVSAGYGYASVLVNGTSVAIGTQGYVSGAGNVSATVSSIIHCTAAQYLQLGFATSVGGTFQGDAGGTLSYLSAALISK